MAPIFEGFYNLNDLREGRVTLWDVALANDAMAVRAENMRRASKKR